MEALVLSDARCEVVTSASVVKLQLPVLDMQINVGGFGPL